MPDFDPITTLRPVPLGDRRELEPDARRKRKAPKKNQGAEDEESRKRKPSDHQVDDYA